MDVDTEGLSHGMAKLYLVLTLTASRDRGQGQDIGTEVTRHGQQVWRLGDTVAPDVFQSV
jgi:hypothetical protein